MNQLSNDILTLCDVSKMGMLLSVHSEALGGAPSIASGDPPPRACYQEALRGPALVQKF
jgi:hypothetical protein